MKIAQIKPAMFTILLSNAKKMVPVVMIAVMITFTFNNTFGKDELSENRSNNMAGFNPDITADIDRITLTGYAETTSDYLQWEVFNSSNIKCFTVECAKTNDLNFIEVNTLKAEEFKDISKKTLFTSKCSNELGSAYYKIKATYIDNSTVESNFIYIKRSQTVPASIGISQIKNENGLITLTFKSPKEQNVTISILHGSGQIIDTKEIAVFQGDNTYAYDASFLPSSEMLIFLLNNREELITKKYILASAW